MKIAPYYQKLLEAGLTAVGSLEPITFSGMFDAACGYLFTLSIPFFRSELDKSITPIFVDLSGLTNEQLIMPEMAFAFSQEFPDFDLKADYFGITKYILKMSAGRKIVLSLYLGQDGETDLGLLQFLNRLRNLLGWNFSYNLFVTTKLLFSDKYNLPLVDKVIKRNNVPVLPLDDANSAVVLANYEERYGVKIKEGLRGKIIDLSGGNPGIIKALYLQEKNQTSGFNPDLLEDTLYIRLWGIASDLPETYKKVLRTAKRISDNYLIFDRLVRYGYLKQGKVFTQLLTEYLVKYDQKTLPRENKPELLVDEKLLLFSKSQRKVFDYLQSHSGQLVTKDEIAKILWGENWADHYSAWAIDQLISTLREKITNSREPGKIVTKKGEGLIYLQN